jgi:putative ABC transport system permease protein
MIAIWTRGAVGARWRQMALSASGVIGGTALVAIVGLFGVSSTQSMVARALSAVPVDWQVALAPGSDVVDVTAKLGTSAKVKASRVVGYADASGFSAHLGGTTQTTGAAQILGLPVDYDAAFPGQIRVLTGTASGVLLSQQTASNLHATLGDTVSLTPTGAPPFDVTITGIVDLPNADALFQTIGPQKGPTASAPPDNVALLPMDQWSRHFAAATQAQGGGARLQIHVGLQRASLPATPDEAFAEVSGQAKNLEVRAAGAVMVGDNLSARLISVRQDAVFARLLLLFLGLPGIVLSLLLSISITRADGARRRREQALLALRGANTGVISMLAVVDAGLMAAAGSLCGVAFAAALASSVLHIAVTSSRALIWLLASGVSGFVIALAAVLIPTLVEIRATNVTARRAWISMDSPPLWHRTFIDFVLIAIGVAIFWHSASTGYQVVLAPEGVAATAVDYTAFLAPLLFWVGSGLFVLRVTGLILRRGRSMFEVVLAPLAGRLKLPVAAALSRQHRRLASGGALVALAVAFATSTAIFNTTYHVQLLVDARLTNGADVAVTGALAAPADAALEAIRATSGVAAAETMQHRFAYVGKDLQDIYGIDAARISNATDIVDAFFAGGSAKDTLARLAATPDGVLASQETVSDFQLVMGDVINLRLPNSGDSQPKVIPFHFIGVVTEFPTAPHDSFLVANAAYLGAQTGNAAAEIVLVRAAGDPAHLAGAIRSKLGPDSTLRISDISQAVHLIGSSLTAVDLRALGDIEMAFAVALVALAAGLTVWLGQGERARANAVLLSLGASAKSIRAFLWSEALVLLGFGLPFGLLIGTSVAWMMVRLLGGVFDPPPDILAYPWLYLACVLAGAFVATIAAVLAQSALSKEWAVRELRAGR